MPRLTVVHVQSGATIVAATEISDVVRRGEAGSGQSECSHVVLTVDRRVSQLLWPRIHRVDPPYTVFCRSRASYSRPANASAGRRCVPKFSQASCVLPASWLHLTSTTVARCTGALLPKRN